MFSRRERLLRADFPTVLSTGRRLSSPYFLLVRSEKAHGYAVVISKKVIRLSVGRHRAKRQVLEALRVLPLPPALIVFVQSKIDNMSFEDIRVELEGLLAKQ